MTVVVRRIAKRLLRVIPPFRRALDERDRVQQLLRQLEGWLPESAADLRAEHWDRVLSRVGQVFDERDRVRQLLKQLEDWLPENVADLRAEHWDRVLSRIQQISDETAKLPDVRWRNEYLERKALSYFLRILSHPALSSARSPQIDAIALGIFLLLISNGHPQSSLFARAYGVLLRGCFAHGHGLDLLIRIYDCAYGLYWVNAASLVEMAGFDSDVVRPFSEFLRRKTPLESPREAVRRSGPLRVVYLCHYAHLTQGNAVSPIVVSLARAHARLKQGTHDVSIMCPLHFQMNFLKAVENSGVAVHHFGEGRTPEAAESIETLRRLQPDVILTDISSGIATAIFEARSAATQMWLEMGYPYWSIRELDWVFLGHKRWRPDFGVPRDRWSPIRYRHDADTIVQADSPEEVADLQRTYPVGSIVFGCFGRYSKITLEFLSAAERILDACPGARFIIAGNGDSGLIRDFVVASPHAARFVVIGRNVNVRSYARVLTAFVETFPFCGGNVSREMTLFGVPIIAMKTDDWPLLMEEARDPVLLADTVDAFVANAVRLANDMDFRRARISIVRELQKEEEQPDDAARGIIARIDALTNHQYSWLSRHDD